MHKSYESLFLYLTKYLGVINIPTLSDMYSHSFSFQERWHLNIVIILMKNTISCVKINPLVQSWSNTIIIYE